MTPEEMEKRIYKTYIYPYVTSKINYRKQLASSTTGGTPRTASYFQSLYK
jgi:hypothetical protein